MPRFTLRDVFLATALIAASIVAVLWLIAEPPEHNYKPEAGYVPDAQTAVKIAVAVWEPIYGAEQIASEKPYQARLANGVWTVEGSLPGDMGGPGPHYRAGGVAIAVISKEDGTILRVSHGK